MPEQQRTYIAIDLKSFYASVECVDRGLDPLTTNPPPRMAHYIEVSTKIYQTYLKYIAPEDIHVYSIDEVIMDVTAYLGSYKLTAHELAMKMIRDVLLKVLVAAITAAATALTTTSCMGHGPF